MASNVVGTGAAGQLVIVATEVGYNAPANWSDISWALYLNEASEYDYSWSGGVGAYVNWNANGWGTGGLWSGSFGFDWRPGGLQSTLIASGISRMSHAGDGTGSLYVEGGIGDTGTSGAGGPASVGVWVPVTTLKVVPGTPTGVTASRVSDTQATVSWAQSSASNGQPVSNQIFKSVNNGAFSKILDINATTSTSLAVAANQKLQFKVQAWNSAGFGGLSAASAPIFTTPAAPSGVTAAKNASLDIVVAFTPNVGYTEHTHVVSHGTITGGITTWDGSPLATLPSGTTSYTHTAPNPAQVHVYRVQAVAGSLASSWVQSNSVQLLAAPNAPSLATIPPFSDKGSAFVVTWTHNAVDSTPQAYYELQYSTNGGSSWTSTGKVTSTVSSRSFAGGTYTSGTTLQVQVRTWGQATTGGSDGTGASPWSSVGSTTFKTAPTVTITTPGSSVGQAIVQVVITFSQPEGATFVSQAIDLLQGATVLETVSTTGLSATLTTRVANGGSYSVRTRATDSNGIQSPAVTQAFTVTYLPPVPAAVAVDFLDDSGFGQLTLSIPSPGAGQAAASKVTILRTINGDSETVADQYAVSASLTFLDTTPVTAGTNTYTVRTISIDGASTDVVVNLVTASPSAYLSKGVGYSEVVSFAYTLALTATPAPAQSLVQAAGRSRPIGLYGTTGNLTIEGRASLIAKSHTARKLGSSPDEIEAVLQTLGRCCYRDPTGRRIFGQVAGQVSRVNAIVGELSYTVTETST
ncbi:hypothetical protein [Microbacterium sp. 22242]|uniref:hypothetical protein n=1 Tax=Microbacterium sp. 22242 TaxID=3453896 RepID=UPI003F85636A